MGECLFIHISICISIYSFLTVIKYARVCHIRHMAYNSRQRNAFIFLPQVIQSKVYHLVDCRFINWWLQWVKFKISLDSQGSVCAPVPPLYTCQHPIACFSSVNHKLSIQLACHVGEKDLPFCCAARRNMQPFDGHLSGTSAEFSKLGAPGLEERWGGMWALFDRAVEKADGWLERVL